MLSEKGLHEEYLSGGTKFWGVSVPKGEGDERRGWQKGWTEQGTKQDREKVLTARIVFRNPGLPDFLMQRTGLSILMALAARYRNIKGDPKCRTPKINLKLKTLKSTHYL